VAARIASEVEEELTILDFGLKKGKSMKQKLWSQVRNSYSDNPKSKIKNPKSVGILAIAVTFIFGGAVVWAQQPKKLARICYLGNTVSGTAEAIKPFQHRLREIGYVEGQNVIIDYRYWEGTVERLPELAAEFVRLNCDVILTAGTEAAEAAKNVIKTIPVVMAFGDDAVRRGIVADLARPGGNITGLTNMGSQIYGKRLELLKETVPKLARVAFLWSPTNLGAADNVKETEHVARFLRVGVQSLEVKGPGDIEGAFQAATKKRAQALMFSGGGLFAAHQTRILELAAKSRLPAMYPNTRYVEAGGLMGYAEDRSEQYRRAAEIVDKILKGTKPAEIPVERPKKFDLVINLIAAKRIGFTVPPNVLVRATRVIR
jgi:putative ABC transport system substrate-binding protein